jgi:beta-galactosidase/beta-glucuronidase
VITTRSEDRRTARASSDALPAARPVVRGKFLFAGGRHLYVRGVTYGTFEPRPDGAQFPSGEVVERDFEAMAAAGLNTVRTYAVPPPEVLDAAARQGLRIMVGLPWEQHVAFLGDRGRPNSIEQRVREVVIACAGHPAILEGGGP